jgi:DNA-binding GntR family transcriptional regulator
MGRDCPTRGSHRVGQEYGVAKGTSVKALDVLGRESMTRTVAGLGTFIAGRG